MKNPFVNIPFFRIIIPFVLGIILASSFTNLTIKFSLVIFVCALVVTVWLIQSKYGKVKSLFLVIADILLLLFGVVLTQENQEFKQTNYFANQYNLDTVRYYVAEANDLPTRKNNFYKVPVKLIALKTDSGFNSIDASSFCYIKTNSIHLLPSQQFIFKAQALEVLPPLNPNEFDYKTYLQNRNITHTFFLDSNCYKSLPTFSSNKLWTLGLTLKQSILNTLKASGLTSEAYAICAALITGYDDEIDRTTISAFSKTGTLHVLSVSGLHTGLIFVVLNFLADIFDRHKRYKISRFIFLTILLWLFALITGFSAPVLRAVIMLNLIGIGQLFFRHTTKNQLNVLAFSAFILLVYNPLYLMDIGFLLSYFALFGLIYFQQPIQSIYEPTSKFLQIIWTNFASSLAATLSTLPITLYYFHQFPIWFVLCNLIIVPATFILLMLAFLLLVKLNWVAVIINKLISFLLWFIQLFNNGSIELIAFTKTDFIFLSVVLILFTLFIQTRSYKLALASCLCVIAWQVVSLTEVHSQKQSAFLINYHCKKSNTIAIKSGNQLIYNALDSLEFDYRIKPHLTALCYADTSISNFNHVVVNNQHILILNKQNFKPYVNPKLINKLIVANNYKLKNTEIEEYSNLREIIVDGSNSYYNINKIEKLSRKFGIALYKTKEIGAYIHYIK